MDLLLSDQGIKLLDQLDKLLVNKSKTLGDLAKGRTFLT
jgi:hypothetical protein